MSQVMHCRLMALLLVAGLLAPVAGAQESYAYSYTVEGEVGPTLRTFSGEDLPLYYRVNSFFGLAREYKSLEIDGKPFPAFYNQLLGRMGIKPGSQEAQDFGAIIDLSHTARISDEERGEIGQQLEAVDGDAWPGIWADWNGRKAAIAGDLWGKLEVLLGPERIEAVLCQVRRSGVGVSTDEPQALWDTAEHFESARENARGAQWTYTPTSELSEPSCAASPMAPSPQQHVQAMPAG